MHGSVGLGESQPQARTDAEPSQRPQEITYYRCLEDHGIPLARTSDGVLRVEKGKDNNAAIMAAEKKCAALMPPPAVRRAGKEEMARAMKLSACLREHGVKDYPDPGPDGEAELSSELIHRMKTDVDYREADRVCDPRPEGDSILGG